MLLRFCYNHRQNLNLNLQIENKVIMKILLTLTTYNFKRRQNRECMCTGMLQWFVNDSLAQNTLHNKYIIKASDVSITPESLASGALDSTAQLRALKKFFESDAWDIVQQTGFFLK